MKMAAHSLLRAMWVITALFGISLVLAHLAIGLPQSLRLHISEMRSLTPFGHALFLLVVVGALWFARRARQRQRNISAAIGIVIAISILAAWMTPTISRAHDFFASAPFVLMSFYVPWMLLRRGYLGAAALVFVMPPICDFVLWLAVVGSSGPVQKVNALLLFGALNFLYYKILPTAEVCGV